MVLKPIILSADQPRYFDRRRNGQNSLRIASCVLQVLKCPSVMVQFLGDVMPIISC
jgi:hypothetical protein